MVTEKQTLNLFAEHVQHAHIIFQNKFYSFDEEGRLNVTVSVDLNDRPLPNNRLPIQFGKITGSFRARWKNLESLEGFPIEVTSNCVIDGNPLTNLVGAPKKVGARLDMEYVITLQSLEGFPQEVQTCIFTWRDDLPLLRLLTAKKLQLDLMNSYGTEPSRAKQCLDILNRYAGQGRRAIHLCAKELIAAGFEENAKW